MCTNVRPVVSKKKEYWISKERYYELKHFCFQYKDWQKMLLALEGLNLNGNLPEFFTTDKYPTSPVERVVIAREHYKNLINMVEEAARLADIDICKFVLMAVTDDISCTSLITKYDMPCGKDKFYVAYRRFFWHLSQLRE